MRALEAQLLLDRVAAPAGAPFDAVYVVVDGEHVCALDFSGYESRMHGLLTRRYPAYRLVEARDPAGASTRVKAYFKGQLAALDALPVKTGGTAFQSAAWMALRQIPPGTTATYSQQAARIGRPKAVRAVGAANGQNPLAIILPCHRVVGSGGALTGYAGGLASKQWLLAHEGALAD